MFSKSIRLEDRSNSDSKAIYREMKINDSHHTQLVHNTVVNNFCTIENYKKYA